MFQQDQPATLKRSLNDQVEDVRTSSIIKIGSILLFVGIVFTTLFLLADLIGGTMYYTYYVNRYVPMFSAHNSPVETVMKCLCLILNIGVLSTAGVYGIKSANSFNSKNSLLHVVFLSLGMILFICEIVFINVCFYTTYDIFELNSYGDIFFPIMLSFSFLFFGGLICCGICCVSGILRYRHVSENVKEVSI